MSEIVVVESGGAAELDPGSSGFAHGFGLFETILLRAGGLAFWADHLERLRRSVRAFGMIPGVEESALLDAVRDLLRIEGLRDGVVKISVLKNRGSVRWFVYTRPAPARRENARLLLDGENVLNDRSPLAGHKTHNYLENMVLLERAKNEGYDEVVRLNTRGRLAETAMANLFFVREGVLSTPALAEGVLPGTIRKEVLDVAENLGMRVREDAFAPEALNHAEAVFLTNSVAGIRPVAEVRGSMVAFETDRPEPPEVRALAEKLRTRERENTVDVFGEG